MQVMDAQGTLFFAKQLEHIKAKTFEVLYPEITYRRVFPINTETPEGADSITYSAFDESGEAKIIANNAKDVPRVDISGSQTSKVVRNLAAGFGYTFFDILKAKQNNLPLDQRKANAARRSIERKMNSIAYLGDDEYEITGLLNDANIPSGNAPNGSWTSASDPDDILEDVIDAMTTPFVSSNGVESANRLLVTPEAKALLATMRLVDTSEEVLLSWIVKNIENLNSPDDIIVVPELIEAGTASKDVMVAMTASPDKCEFEIPMDITFLPQQEIGLEYVTNVVARCAGLNMYYPISCYISEGV